MNDKEKESDEKVCEVCYNKVNVSEMKIKLFEPVKGLEKFNEVLLYMCEKCKNDEMKIKTLKYEVIDSLYCSIKLELRKGRIIFKEFYKALEDTKKTLRKVRRKRKESIEEILKYNSKFVPVSERERLKSILSNHKQNKIEVDIEEVNKKADNRTEYHSEVA